MRRLALLLGLLAAAAPPARADEPRGPSASAALGWPGSWVEVGGAVGSRLYLGGRGEILYGSPVMGPGAGLGGRIAVPMRITLPNPARVHLELRLLPWAGSGDAELFGEPRPLQKHLGYGFGLDTQGLLRFPAGRSVEVLAGVGLGAGAALTPDAPGGARGFGTFTALGGLETPVRGRLR